MKVTSFVLFGSAVASQMVAARSATGTTGLRQHRRELLKTLYARQDYPVQTTAPTCEEGYDTPDPTTGECICGPGREKQGDLCVTVIVEAQYNTFKLVEPVRPAFAVSSTNPYRGAKDFLNVNQCAAIAKDLEGDGSRGFYLEESMVPNENNCWIIGDQNSNPSLFFPPSTTGIPFTPDNATKRAVVESGSIGSPGGTIGFAGAVAEPVPGSGSCDASLGDTPTPSGVCQCGDGRVPANTENTLCKFTPSAGARLRRAAAMKNASW